MTRLKLPSWTTLTVVSIVAGLIYDSWPLGYWLNPDVSKDGLASALEGLHQPYNWLFIGADVFCSLLILGVAYMSWQRLRAQRQQTRWLAATLINVGLFSVGTIVDALLPIRCDPTIQVCPSFTQDHLLLVHGIFSIVAALSLFVSLALLWLHRPRSLVLNMVVFGYILFSVFSLLSILIPGQGNWAQHYYLTLCSLWIALIPLSISRDITRQKGQPGPAPPTQSLAGA